MAIHDKFEVRVFVKGKPVHEYDGPENRTEPLANGKTARRKTGPVVERCIESVPGENFAIELKTNEASISSHVKPYLSELRSMESLQTAWLLRRKSTTVGLAGWSLSRELQIAFEASGNCANSGSKIFTQTQCHRTRSSMQLIKQGAPELKEDDRGISQIKVSERHLKGQAIDSLTGFDIAETTNGYTVWDADFVDNEPLVTFNFRHYTRNGLKNLGIINEPQPLDPFVLLDAEKLTQEESLRLLDIANAGLQNSRRRIKQENQHSNSSPGSNKRVRTQYDPDELEEIPPPAPRPTPQNGGSID
ncbi:hypothetical protein LTR70_004113 [Exophiala xenobiotica]|uniref:DUF7918 domain-containing protein n=1 Tax=Lithohypha guttulata TaxID=1690604 RepID=A0ABR0KEE9_9EURO|nr:hypothetical protein LTR24_003606 [Lithohypha guttulata]KAK5321558.1 hypothetical protein LTR70_004113 [Exophiala xenobiotica]